MEKIENGSYRTADAAAQIDWELKPTDQGLEFSATGKTSDGHGGQCLDEIAKRYPDDAMVQRIHKVWKQWHLNGLRADCEHQIGWGDKELSYVKIDAPVVTPRMVYPCLATLSSNLKGGQLRRHQPKAVQDAIESHRGMDFAAYWWVIEAIYKNGLSGKAFARPLPKDIDWFVTAYGCKLTEETKTANWLRPTEHPEGVLCKPCPTCGYAYGSAWRHHKLPDDVVTEIRSWVSNASEALEVSNSKDFLKRHGITMRITLSDTKVASWSPSGHHYRVTLSAPGRNRLVFDYWGSQHDAEHKVDPKPYDVLSCISSDINCETKFEHWCGTMGESADSIKALQIFKRCSAFASRLRSFFPKQEQEELSTIQ